MLRSLVAALVVVSPVLALAQGAPPGTPDARIVVVPYPGEVPDAGALQAQPSVAQQPAAPAFTQPPAQPADSTPRQPVDVPALAAETRTIDAVTPPPLPTGDAVKPPPPPDLNAPGAFLDGHPREGAFLAGTGSMAFVLHHTILGGLGVLATQMVPRVADSLTNHDSNWGNQDARVAYLAGTLIGAGVGFGASAWWQFNNWISQSSATFAMINSLVGAMFMGGFTNLFTSSALPISWLALLGAELGGWVTTIVGGGDMPMNKGALIASGAAWAAIYTALILAVVATTGNGFNLKGGMDALMITPALGAAAMAAATLKFNPSTAQIVRANLFGVGVGGAVLVLAALVLGVNFASPVPYLLAALGAVGGKAAVSLLWAEAAETPGHADALPEDHRYRSVW